MRKITHICCWITFWSISFLDREEVELLDHDGFHRVDRGQEIRDQVPCIAAIGAGEDLAGVGANVDPAGIERVRAQAVTQHAQAYTWARGQPFGEWLPLLAAILRAIDRKLLA